MPPKTYPDITAFRDWRYISIFLWDIDITTPLSEPLNAPLCPTSVHSEQLSREQQFIFICELHILFTSTFSKSRPTWMQAYDWPKLDVLFLRRSFLLRYAISRLKWFSVIHVQIYHNGRYNCIRSHCVHSNPIHCRINHIEMDVVTSNLPTHHPHNATWQLTVPSAARLEKGRSALTLFSDLKQPPVHIAPARPQLSGPSPHRSLSVSQGRQQPRPAEVPTTPQTLPHHGPAHSFSWDVTVWGYT